MLRLNKRTRDANRRWLKRCQLIAEEKERTSSLRWDEVAWRRWRLNLLDANNCAAVGRAVNVLGTKEMARLEQFKIRELVTLHAPEQLRVLLQDERAFMFLEAWDRTHFYRRLSLARRNRGAPLATIDARTHVGRG